MGYRRGNLLPLVLILAGCSGTGESPSEPPYDTERARSALVAALEAWKKGEAKALPKRVPPIRFVDDDLISGLRLSDYEIESPDGPIGPHADVDVVLSLRDKHNQPIQREARYQVATEPGLAVLRSDR
ncbi:hypothetical protein P12x_002693 [Tundrisphaera lichenicola]|uniref:hypothetical protein n=1 Tax=Tundrisphaera lichenicola TaxID=2029860 RepID=UPI003EBE66DE